MNKYMYVDLITLLPPPATTTGDETKDKKPATTESFDQWLEAWSVHEKTYITNPARYAELAQYRGIIQKANWKFRWKAVYDFDVQFRMSLSGTTKRLDQIDSTLYTTIVFTILQDYFHCDNQSVVHILNSGTSRCHHIMSLIHYLFYVCCKCHGAHTHAQKLTHCCFMSIAGGPISRTGSSRGSLIHPSTSLGLSKLQVRAEHFFHRGLTSTTQRTYSSTQRQYLMFCDTHNLNALPGDENTIRFFITDLAKILVAAH